jgi:hypothetical protein
MKQYSVKMNLSLSEECSWYNFSSSGKRTSNFDKPMEEFMKIIQTNLTEEVTFSSLAEKSNPYSLVWENEVYYSKLGLELESLNSHFLPSTLY